MTTSNGQFLIYEEHSVYRREFLERVSSAADAHTRALAYSRRTRLPVSVRTTRQGLDPSMIVSSYLGGKCLPHAPADSGAFPHKDQ
jgi:hypothetical protein